MHWNLHFTYTKLYSFIPIFISSWLFIYYSPGLYEILFLKHGDFFFLGYFLIYGVIDLICQQN